MKSVDSEALTVSNLKSAFDLNLNYHYKKKKKKTHLRKWNCSKRSAVMLMCLKRRNGLCGEFFHRHKIERNISTYLTVPNNINNK